MGGAPGFCILPFMDGEHTTIRRTVRAEIRVRGSLFVATAAPVDSPAGVQEQLEEVRREYHDATHHCYAYRIGPRGDQYKAHDGGEPAGSAGKPILGALEREGLTDIVLVVTRYFGGTKLGIGGLARAYASAAQEAIRSAEKVTVYACERWKVSFPHAQISTVMYLLNRFEVRILETRYDQEVTITVEVRQGRSPGLREQLVNRTSGSIRLLPLE